MSRTKLVAPPASDHFLPILALLSTDEQLNETVRRAAQSEWFLMRPSIAEISSLVSQPNVKLVVFDDQSVGPSDRGWALSEIRRCASRASIIYVAGEHDPESEKQARIRGVLFYTAKPLILGDVILLMQRLLHMQNGKRDLAKRQLRRQG